MHTAAAAGRTEVLDVINELLKAFGKEPLPSTPEAAH